MDLYVPYGVKHIAQKVKSNALEAKTTMTAKKEMYAYVDQLAMIINSAQGIAQ